MGPKDTFQFHGDGALKMYCFVCTFCALRGCDLENQADRQCCPFIRKVSKEKISLGKEDRVMHLIRPHIKKS